MNLLNLESAKKYKIVIALIIIYLFGVILYYCIGSYSKNLFFVPDERLYLQAAKALANGDGISYNGMSSTFQKIVYSIIISPAFLVKDLHTQIRLVCLIGTLAEMTYIFPVYLISRKLSLSRVKSLMMCLFSLSFPALLFSMTFMSETAFLPLWLWTIYLITIMLESDQIKIAVPIVLGVVAYLLYMCKEVGIVAIPAMVFVKIILMVRKKDSIKGFISCGISIVTFGVLFLLIKYLVFSGSNSSYSYSITALQAPETSNKNPLSFFLYAAFFYLSYIILVNNIFPLFVRSNKNELSSRLTTYLEIAILMLIFIVVYKISLKEDYGLLAPRLHLRYMEPLFIPYFLCFFSRLEDVEGERPFSNKYLKWAFIIYLIVLFIIPGLNLDGFLDSTTSTFYLIPNKFALRFFLGSPLKTTILTYVMKLMILIVVFLGLKLLKRNKKGFVITFVSVALIINIVSAGLKYHDIRSGYELSEKYVAEMQKINDEMESLPGRKLYIVREISRLNEIVITYYDINNTDVYSALEDYNPSDEIITLNAGNATRDVSISDYDYIIYDSGIWEESEKEPFSAEYIILSTENFFVIKQ